MLIALEGLDAAGKATQAQLLAKFLNNERYYATVAGFPDYETSTGQAIRGLLTGELSVAGGGINAALVLQSMQTLNRFEKLPFLRKKRAESREVLVLDRYFGSGIAYGAAHGVDVGFLETIHETLPLPDLCILLDIPAERSWERRPERRDAYERDFDFLVRVREQYLQLFERRAQAKQPWVVINADTCIEGVRKAIRELVIDRIVFPQILGNL